MACLIIFKYSNMSKKIGIVCEGISDYRVLKYITERYLKDKDVYVIPLKPKETASGKQDGFGSWQGVLEYIHGNDQMILEAIREGCHFIIVHIDTDVRTDYGLSSDYENQELLHASVKDLILSKVHPDFNKYKLLFAIAIHETECWLIPFLTDDGKCCSKTVSCVSVVNRLLKGDGYIDKDNKNAEQVQPVYEKILRSLKKPKQIQTASLKNFGFKYFIESLDSIREILD